jgi:UDP-glucose 4-epimerase
MKEVLVTGGAGFIGSHLVEQLVHRGDHVTVIDDLSNGNTENLRMVWDKIEFIKGDVSKPLTKLELAEPIDQIFHLACFPRSMSFDNPTRDTEVNALSTLNVIELARKSDSKIVFSSNSGIYDTSIIPIDENTSNNSKTPYDLNKLQSEEYLKLYNKTFGTKYTIFRFATVYGPRQNVSPDWKPVVVEFISKLKNDEKATIYWDGDQTRDFIFVADLVKALVSTLDDKKGIGETMILGSGVETSINDLYNIVSDLLDKKIEPIRKPMQLGDIKRMRYNCEKAKTILNWRAETSLTEGVEKIIEWMN